MRLIPILLILAGCSRTQPDFAPQSLGDKPGIHNLFKLNDNLYSGSAPEGSAGFATLKELGIKTVISVDGSAPDIEEAKKHDMRYVHLPIGYDGVPRERAIKIAKAIKELPGPIYLHCHHGKHRGPAAAIAGLRCLDEKCSAQAALEFLKSAGTDARYGGLYRDVEAMTPADLSGVIEFPEKAPVGNLVKAMVLIDETWDRIKEIKAAGWKAPEKHPDLVPANEALQLLEHYRELNRLSEISKKPEDFRILLHGAISNAETLERTLREKTNADNAFKASSADCTKCHGEYRDKKGGLYTSR